MRAMSSDWCFEGGCTYTTDMAAATDTTDFDELEAMYRENCIGMAD